MSILIMGLTICPICKKTINEGDNFYLFPPFVINKCDELYFFSDESCHLECLTIENGGQKAIKYTEMYIQSNRPLNRKCLISGELITSPENQIFIEYLTSDIKSNLHQFNFSHINKLNLLKWDYRESFLKELNKFKDLNNWAETNNGRYLTGLIEKIRSAAS